MAHPVPAGAMYAAEMYVTPIWPHTGSYRFRASVTGGQ